MAASTWVYSDWGTLPYGTQARVDRLNLHIQEVADFLKNPSFRIYGRDVQVTDSANIKYLELLRETERKEAQATGSANGRRIGFSRGKAPL